MKSLCLKIAVFLSAVLSGYGASGNTLCAYSKQENVKYKRMDLTIEDESSHQHSIAGHNVDANNTEHCSKESDSCFALWYEDPVNKSIIILTQGCWDSSGNGNCDQNECISNVKPKALNHTKFCCCSENLCNMNVTDGYISSAMDPALHYVDPIAYTSSTVIVIAVAAMIVFIVLALVAYYLFKFHFHPPKRSKESLHLIESATPAPVYDFDSLKIQETIGKGRYGTVCRGILQDHTVAVKIFSFQNKQYFLNEKDIYTLPHMEHASLLKFIGSEERVGSDGRPEFLIVLSFSAIGCLQDYLRNTTIDWQRLCKMSLSIACGLAHLHTEVGKGDRVKPCVAHRDLTSRNILMKGDGTCILCDFGFAIRISGSKYFQNGEEQVAETTSLADVGTLRYMAPEILEGAVNLRDCESSLKQIDVYALGLIIWEIATRCTDLFQGMEMSEYKLPFESEVGVHPTMEQMQILVTRHKARPLFPDIWKDSNPAVRTLKETIEECWDQDAEARLTTLCVEERLAELPVLWERYKAGLVMPICVSAANVNVTSNEKALPKIQSSGDIPYETLNNSDLHVMRDRAHSLSEGTTDTLLSPSEPLKDFTPMGNLKNSIAENATASFKVSIPLQPHQGRNPCLERNLMSQPVDEVEVRGNTLLGRDIKIPIDKNYHSYSEGDTAAFGSPMMDNGSLLSNDLNHSTKTSNPIQYVFNAVHNASSVPKQPNIPGNGHSLEHKDSSDIREGKHWRPLHFFDRKKSGREGIRTSFKNFLERRSYSTNQKDLAEEQQPLRGPLMNSYSPSSPNLFDSKFGQTNNLNYIWTPEDFKGNDLLVDTEVRVIKSDLSSTVVRPVNNVQLSSKDDKDKQDLNEVTMSVRSNASTDSVTSNEAVIEEKTDKTKRPNSLALLECHYSGTENFATETHTQEENSESFKVPMRRKNSNGKRKGVKRVKTPFEIKGRFSLYDDRIMSSQELSKAYSKETIQTILGENTKFSTSVPLDMNTLCSSQSTDAMHSSVTQMKCENIKVKNGLKLPANVNQMQVINSFCDV